MFTAAGWGQWANLLDPEVGSDAQFANALQKVKLPFVDDEACDQTYSKLKKIVTRDTFRAGTNKIHFKFRPYQVVNSSCRVKELVYNFMIHLEPGFI